MAYNQHPDIENIFFKNANDGDFIRRVLKEKFRIFGMIVNYWYIPRSYLRKKPPFTKGSAVYDEPRTPPDHIINESVVNEWDWLGPYKIYCVLRDVKDDDQPDEKGAQGTETRNAWFLREEIAAIGAEEFCEGDIIEYNGFYFDCLRANRAGWMNPGTFFLFDCDLMRRIKYFPERKIPEGQR